MNLSTANTSVSANTDLERGGSLALDAPALNTLFHGARTHVAWQDRPVPDALLRGLYALARMPPTSANIQPMRLAFVKSPDAKERLRPALAAGNVEKVMTAPVTAIVAYDRAFHEQLPKLFPSRDLRSTFAAQPEAKREDTARVNAWLQAGYLILGARSLGLDVGPIGGFDAAQVDATFFPDGQWRSFLLVNLGYGLREKLHPRNPRLSFEEAARIW